MQRFYGVQLADLWRGHLTLRQVKVYIGGLPPDSIAARRIAGVDLDSPLLTLSYADVLLARVSDELAALRWEFEAAHTDAKHKHRLRKPPRSVLAVFERSTTPSNVVPLVSPHELGGFMTTDPGEED